jgi:hypothetical protein
MIHQPSIGGTRYISDLELQRDEIKRTKGLGRVSAENCGPSYEKVLKDFTIIGWMRSGAIRHVDKIPIALKFCFSLMTCQRNAGSGLCVTERETSSI